MRTTKCFIFRHLWLVGAGFVGCHPGPSAVTDSGSSIAGAADEVTDKDRGTCSVSLGGFKFIFREERTYQGNNRGRPESDPDNMNKYNYGDQWNILVDVMEGEEKLKSEARSLKFFESLKSTWLVSFDNGDGSFRKAEVRLRPEEELYGISVDLRDRSNKILASTKGACPNWDDKPKR